MKVIFLDIYGVMVTRKSEELGALRSREEYASFCSSFYWNHRVDMECMKRLATVVKETGALLVITSEWRKDANQMAGLKRALRDVELPARRIQRTPVLGDRGQEIQAWLDEHDNGEETDQSHPDYVSNYIVLDDNHVSGGHTQLSNRPSHYHGGLLDEHVGEAIIVLNDTNL